MFISLILLISATGRPVDINIFIPFCFAFVKALIVDCGTLWVLNDISVPSISKKAAFIVISYLFTNAKVLKDFVI